MNKLFWKGQFQTPCFQSHARLKRRVFSLESCFFISTPKEMALYCNTQMPCLAFGQLDWILAAT